MSNNIKHNNMPTFIYEGKTRNQTKIKGELTAKNMTLAKIHLRKQGIHIQAIREKPKPLLAKYMKKNIRHLEIMWFTRQLATMIKAGVPLVQSIEMIATTADHPAMRQLLFNLKTSIEAGHGFADALRHYPRYFDYLFCALIEAGELSGTLETMLERIAQYQEKSEALKQKIKKALSYPLIVIFVGIVVAIILMIHVVPIFQELFHSFGAQLPWFTQIIIQISQWMQKYWFMSLSCIVMFLLGIQQSYQRTQLCRHIYDQLLLKLPIFGNLIYQTMIARYSRTLATTFAAGVPLIDALTATANATHNTLYKNTILNIRDEVATGQQLQFAMRISNRFPSMAIQMIAVGEESGALDMMLDKVANYYENEMNHRVEQLTAMMEPFIMILLGVLVGSLVIAMYLPIFQMGSII